MYPLVIVEFQPFIRSLPDAFGVLVKFIVDGSVHPFHIGVPPGGLFGDEEVRDILPSQPVVEFSPKLAVIVVLH